MKTAFIGTIKIPTFLLCETSLFLSFFFSLFLSSSLSSFLPLFIPPPLPMRLVRICTIHFNQGSPLFSLHTHFPYSMTKSHKQLLLSTWKRRTERNPFNNFGEFCNAQIEWNEFIDFFLYIPSLYLDEYYEVSIEMWIDTNFYRTRFQWSYKQCENVKAKQNALFNKMTYYRNFVNEKREKTNLMKSQYVKCMSECRSHMKAS